MIDEMHSEFYGLELIEKSGVQGGALYPMLAKLERQGWVSSRWEDIDEAAEGRRRRRYYRLTADGARQAASLLNDTAQKLVPPKTVLRQLGLAKGSFGA